MATPKMIRCQVCGVALRKNRMARHVDEVHINPGGGPIFVARPVPQNSISHRPKKPRNSPQQPPKP